MFSSSFSIRRCISLARYDLAVRKRYYLLSFLGIYALLTIVGMGCATGYTPDGPDDTVIINVAQWKILYSSSAIMILLFISLLASCFDRMGKQKGRSAFLMLPARRSEKYVTAIVERFVLTLAMLLAAYVLADLTRAVAFAGTTYYSGLTIDLLAKPYLWECFFFDTANGETFNMLLGTAIKMELYVFFIMMGTLFPRFAPIWAWGCFVALIILLGVLLGTMMSTLSVHVLAFMTDWTVMRWILMVQALVAIVVGLYASWRSFCRVQLVRRKLF